MCTAMLHSCSQPGHTTLLAGRAFSSKPCAFRAETAAAGEGKGREDLHHNQCGQGVGRVQQQNVRQSSRRYLPKTHRVIIDNSIKIISARSMFGEEFPGDFARWKIEAFKTILSSTDRIVLLFLVSWSLT